MGLTTFLEVYPSDRFDPGDSSSTLLFEAKVAPPFGWFLFFDVEDFKAVKSASDGSKYTLLRHEHASAIERARQRLSKIAGWCTEDLRRALHGFIESVSASGDGVLVLNSHRVEASRSEMLAPLKWFASLEKKGITERVVEQGKGIFDQCEGIEFEENDDGVVELGIGEWGGLTGWPLRAKNTEWFDAEPAEREESSETPGADALLARVWASDEPGAREACGAQLAKLGDPRGEFIHLQCQAVLTLKQERREEALLKAHREKFSAPFRGHVDFHRGFAHGVTWKVVEADPLIGHPAWGTVRSVAFTGPDPAVLLSPVMRSVERVIVSPETVCALKNLGVALPFASVCFAGDQSPETWSALRSVESFPALVEVIVTGGFSMWLPEGAQRLIHERPTVRVTSGRPSTIVGPLRLLTEEEARVRVARWATPPREKFLPGPRYDNGFT